MLVAHRPPASPAPLRTLSAMHLLPSVLRRPTALLAFAALWLGTQLHLFAQPATGAIAGRVLNPASGAYLGGARLTLEGTALETFSDADGAYLLSPVPAGEVRVRVFYTGSAPQTATVRVTAAQTTVHDLALTSVARPPARPDETVQLEKFTVSTSKEMEGAAIAINEQRFAANIKTVVSTDEFGAIAEGNVTEFLKYLPGVTVDMSGGDGRYISIEGAPAANTPVPRRHQPLLARRQQHQPRRRSRLLQPQQHRPHRGFPLAHARHARQGPRRRRQPRPPQLV